jgi:hypothetical protein
MKKDILVNDYVVHLSLNEPVHRYEYNPILTAHDVNKVWTSPRQRVVTVHNAGITVFNK